MEEEIDVVQESRKDIKATCSSPLSVSFGNADELLLMLKQFRSGLVYLFKFPGLCTWYDKYSIILLYVINKMS